MLLLDTHMFIWWLADDPRLPKKLIKTIDQSQMAVYVSAASIWEIAIKRRLERFAVR